VTVASWFGFIGAWLLVVGPLYQGGFELLEEDTHREDSAALFEGITPPTMPSSWWWLLPPVMLVRRRRRTAAYRGLVLSRMTPEQRASRAGFLQKATGWFVVAAGASCLAVKETWDLSEHLQWPVWFFAVIFAVMFAGSAAGTVFALARTRPAASPSH
jgi:hypothetical protein